MILRARNTWNVSIGVFQSKDWRLAFSEANTAQYKHFRKKNE